MFKTTILAASLAVSLSAHSLEPAFGDSFNFTLEGVKLSELTRDNFYDVIVPLAEAEKTINVFDFSSSLGAIFNEVTIPAFESKYKVTVNYYKVDGDAAAQQVLAALNANRDAPVDLFFIGAGAPLNTLFNAGALANIPFYQLLPNMTDVRPDLATSVNGVEHGGAYAPFHLNQVSLAYSSRHVSANELPRSLDGLLTYAKNNPMKVAITSPLRGGSGEGFMASVSMSQMTPECLDEAHDFTRNAAQARGWVQACAGPVVDYYNSLKPYVEFTNGNADTLNLLANNQVYMGTAWEDMTYTYLNQSLLPHDVRQMVPEPGLVGGADGLLIPRNAKNKAAAMLFLNELQSTRTQVEKAQRLGSRSALAHIDFETEIPQDKMQFLVPSDNLHGREQNWYNKLYVKALAEHITLEVLAQ